MCINTLPPNAAEEYPLPPPFVWERTHDKDSSGGWIGAVDERSARMWIRCTEKGYTIRAQPDPLGAPYQELQTGIPTLHEAMLYISNTMLLGEYCYERKRK